MLGGNMAAVVLQAVQFILLARTLGVEEYSQFAAVAAIVAICLPLAGLGYANVMLMEVARDKNTAPVQVGNTLFATVTMGAALTVAVGGIAYCTYGPQGGWPLALILGFAELVLVRTNLAIGQVYQAFDQIGKCSRINVTNSLARVVAVLILLTQSKPQAITWATTAMLILAGLVLLNWRGLKVIVQNLRVDWVILRSDASEAMYHALGTTAKAGYTDLDKVILAKYGPPNQVGEYTSAYRLAIMAFMPVRTLLDVVAVKFYTTGQHGVIATLALSMKLMKVAAPYGVIVGLAMYFMAPVIPVVLGGSYRESEEIMRWLAPLPFIQSLYYVLSASLTSTGYQRIRTLIQFLVLSVYGIAGFVAIPIYGWKGAIGVVLFSESLLVVLAASALFVLSRIEIERKAFR